jgi:hypothetical protein
MLYPEIGSGVDGRMDESGLIGAGSPARDDHPTMLHLLRQWNYRAAGMEAGIEPIIIAVEYRGRRRA